MSSVEDKEMLEQMKKDKEGKNKKFWSPPQDKEGNFQIRILPRIKDNEEKTFYHKHKVHWIDGKAYECVAQDFVDKNGEFHAAEKCPVCSLVQQLYNSGERDSEEWKLASQLRAQDRYIYRVVVRSKENQTEPEYYESGKSIYNILYHIIAESDFGDITSLKDGRDFILSKKGTGRLSKYETSSPSANSSPVFSNADELKALIANMKKMDYKSLIEYVNPVDLKRILKNFIEGDSTSDDSSENKPDKVEESPAVTASTPVAVKHAEKPPKDMSEIDSILDEFEDV